MTEQADAGAATDGVEADAAPEAEATGGDGGRPGGAKALGLARYVQFGFAGAALALFWLLDKVITAIWVRFAEPSEIVVASGAAVCAVVTAIVLYRHETVHRLAHEVGIELSKVTWPTRKETYAATIVVIVTSIVAAALLGVFDAVWSKLTDLVYEVERLRS